MPPRPTLPTLPPEITQPTLQDALSVSVQLRQALRSVGIWLEQVAADSESGRPVVKLRGALNVGTAEVLIGVLAEMRASTGRPVAVQGPLNTVKVKANPLTVQIGDFIPLESGCHEVLNMKGRSGTSRVLELAGREPWVMTGERDVFRYSARMGPLA